MPTNTRVAQHTPGPWTSAIAEGGNLFVRSVDGSPICGFQTSIIAGEGSNQSWYAAYAEFERGERREANARLIAAAPDLLQTLRDIVHESLSGASYAADRIRGLANDAIAKAEGQP